MSGAGFESEAAGSRRRARFDQRPTESARPGTGGHFHGTGSATRARRTLAVDRRMIRRAWPDVLLAGLLTLATLVVHNLGYMFSAPFWNDEAWVAISTKLPLHQVTTVSSVTPVGWTLLLRLVFFGGDQRLRVVPLLFSALTVLTAYCYVRSLPWHRLSVGRCAAVLGGAAALLAPTALLRDDLKPYTADAFVTVLVLWLVCRLESSWSRRRMLTLALVVLVGFLFSAVSVFVGAAAIGSVVLTNLVRRNWPRTIESLVVGGVAGVLLVSVYLVLYRPGLPAGVNNYWAAFYLPVSEGWSAVWRYLVVGGGQMAHYLGLGTLSVALILLIAGVVTLVRLGRSALAVTVPLLLVEMIALGALKQYPLFDLRTSHFLTTAIAVTAAIGVGGLCALLARVHGASAVVLTVVALALYLVNPDVHTVLRTTRAIPAEDLRTPTDYVAAHEQPGDVIVVGFLSSWGFGYYWTKDQPVREPTTANLQGFVVGFPKRPGIVIVRDRTRSGVDAAMAQASAAASRVGPGARVWLVHDHTTAAERADFAAAMSADGFTDQNLIPTRLDLLTRTVG